MSEFVVRQRVEFQQLREEIRELQREVRALRRQRTSAGDTPLQTFAAQLTQQLNQAATATCKLFEWSGAGWVELCTVTVREFTLNLAESYPNGMKGWVTLDKGGTYWFASDGCSADDTGLGGGLPPPSAPSGGDGSLLGHGGEGVLLSLVGESGDGAAGGFYDGFLVPK